MGLLPWRRTTILIPEALRTERSSTPQGLWFALEQRGGACGWAGGALGVGCVDRTSEGPRHALPAVWLREVILKPLGLLAEQGDECGSPWE